MSSKFNIRRRARYTIAKRLSACSSRPMPAEINVSCSSVTADVNVLCSSMTADVNLACSSVTADVNVACSSVTADVNVACSSVTADVNVACSSLTADVNDDESDSEYESSDDVCAEVEASIQVDLCDSLHQWAVRFGITLIALSALLCLLRKYHPTLPKDGRTMMKTPRVTQIEQKAGGSFFHFGLISGIKILIDKVYDRFPQQSALNLQLNVDGLPLYKSSAMQFWPVLGLLQMFGRNFIFVVTLFCGVSKPSSLADFLGPVAMEISNLRQGLEHRGKSFVVNVTAIICDAPARAFVKAIKSHNGYSGCDKCVQAGEYISHKMTFPDCHASLRTDDEFKNYHDGDHHVGQSPLTGVGVGMVSQFPHDYMHLVCLGVMRRLIHYWLKGPLLCRMSGHLVQQLSARLVALRAYMPVEFARKPRALKELDRWKAVELRQFLLYTGPVTLLGIVQGEIYNNFMLFSVALYILSSATLSSTHCSYAKELLVAFVEHCKQLYGVENIVYNVHGLVHLADDVKQHGPVHTFSGFPFENYLGTLKRLVRKAHLPLSQVVRRLLEMESVKCSPCDIFSDSIQYGSVHSNGPVPQQLQPCDSQYKQVILSSFTLKLSDGDNCISIGGSLVGLVRNIVVYRGETFLVYEEYKSCRNFFTYPCQSSDMNIYVISKLSGVLQYRKLCEQIAKCVRIPYGKEFVAVPLLHV